MTGVTDIPAGDYHAGDFDTRPALSASIINVLRNQSPAHAWTAHPKLNPDYVQEESTVFDIGTTAHALFLENDATGVVVLDFDDYRTKAAKEARDYARSLGQIPMLQKHWDDVSELVEGARSSVAAIKADPPLFVGGKPERTIVWEEPCGTLCKMRPDYLHDSGEACDDLKTARTAAPEAVARAVFGNGYDVQAAFYLRGIKAATGKDAVFRLVFVEKDPPYAAAAYQLAPAALALANQKIDFALGLWRDCLERNHWPSYPATVMHVEPPAWEETRMFEREYREEGV